MLSATKDPNVFPNGRVPATTLLINPTHAIDEERDADAHAFYDERDEQVHAFVEEKIRQEVVAGSRPLP